MPLRKRPPRLTMDEWRALGLACKQMDALAALLHASGWSGKGMALVELSHAYETVAWIYNRAEAGILGKPLPPDMPPPQAGPEEGGSGESSSSVSGAAPGSLEA